MPLELVIVTPQGERFRGSVESVVLPGTEGDFGVLPEHERYLTPLRVGVAEIRTASGIAFAAVADGFADVQGDAVAVLVESCELANDVDAARAQRARERAEQGLAALDQDAERVRYEAFEAALARAQARHEAGRRS